VEENEGAKRRRMSLKPSGLGPSYTTKFFAGDRKCTGLEANDSVGENGKR